MSDIAQQIRHLRLAELQFRLASAVRVASTFKSQPRDLPIDWSHGKHSVRYDEIALSEDDADYAAWSLHRSATFLMAVAIKDAIRAAVHDPKADRDANVRSAYQIARLIRNAFAHAPFDPMWSIDRDCRNRVFAVRNLIKLDTNGLHDQRFDWRHYGGPIAVLRLSQFVREKILKDTQPKSRIIPMPKEVYIPQGDLIFKKLDKIPPGAVPVKIAPLPDGSIPLGGGYVLGPQESKSRDTDVT